MAQIYISEHGKIRSLDDIELAEKITETRQKKDPWAVIDQLVNVWAKRAPEDVEAMRINVEQYRESQLDSKYAQTKDGKDFERRFTLAFPKTLMLLIRTQYKSEELPFDKAFFKEFANRYPAFRVAEKV